jgi:DNA-binding transcriptional MerR regulator
MATETDPRYTLTQLADLAGVTARTVRYYISQGLLAVDAPPGPGPKYDDTHLARLRLIRRLQAEHQPLAEIRRTLEGLADADVIALAGEAPPAPTDSALDYIRSLTSPVHRVSEDRAAPAPARFTASLARVAPAAAATGAAPAPPPPPPPEPVTRLERSQWERIDLAPDIELHVRRPLTRGTAKQLDRLIQIARDLFAKENPS